MHSAVFVFLGKCVMWHKPLFWWKATRRTFHIPETPGRLTAGISKMMETPSFESPLPEVSIFRDFQVSFPGVWHPCGSTHRSNIRVGGLEIEWAPLGCLVICKSGLITIYDQGIIHVYTLPETNIAMENSPFWWYLPGKMGIFMGFVSFREGIFIFWERVASCAFTDKFLGHPK